MKTVIVFRTGAPGTWREKYNGIAAYAKSAQWMLHPVDARAAPPDFQHLIGYWNPDGIIVDASGSPKIFRNDAFGSLPVVMMNPESEIKGLQHPSVMSDSGAITKLATAELLQMNPSSLVFVEWFDPSISWSIVKRTAIEEIARMHQIPLTVVTPARDDAENTARLEERIAAALEDAPRPCGVFAITDLIGAAAVSAANHVKASIPDDVSVVSVDDDPEICESCSPTLTSVRPDFHQLGFAAGKLLAEAMEKKACGAKCVVVPPLGIVRRASTMKTRVFDKKVSEALETIRLHACDGLAPKDVSAPFGLSTRMAEIRFKAATGKTIGEMIIDQRLSAACNYLKDGKISIFAIANFCGWNSDLAFRKAFKSRFGVSPREWQKSHPKQ